MMDCGVGWQGQLAIMDIDSEEINLSDVQMPATRIIERDELP